MKKVLILASFFCMFILEPATASINYFSVTKCMQQTQWENLGKVSFIACREGASFYYRGEGILYVRIIGKREYYKLKINNKFYSVSIGRYTINGKKYNAKAGENYYFNL